MDRRPAWLRVVTAITCAVGMLAFLAGPAPYVWHPTAQDRWLWPGGAEELAGTTVDGVAVGDTDVIVLDPFTTSEHTVRQVHATSRAAVCRLRAGVWEAGRPDQTRVDRSLIGAAASPDSHWLDVREWSRLSEVLSDRLALCATKGFDGVALTNMDGYAQATGFPITAADQLRFNTAVVASAHSYGLMVAVAANRRTPVPVEADVVVTEPRCVKPVAADGNVRAAPAFRGPATKTVHKGRSGGARSGAWLAPGA
jgi:hypothetical protein